MQARLDGEAETRAAASEGRREDLTERLTRQKKEFIEVTKRLKLLTDRRAQILARVGDEYVMAPPKVAGETLSDASRAMMQTQGTESARSKAAVAL